MFTIKRALPLREGKEEPLEINIYRVSTMDTKLFVVYNISISKNETNMSGDNYILWFNEFHGMAILSSLHPFHGYVCIQLIIANNLTDTVKLRSEACIISIFVENYDMGGS